MTNKQQILIIKLSAFGDFVLCFAAFEAIRKHHPDAEITLLTTKPFAELAQKSPWFDHVWIDERPRWYRPQKWLQLRAKLKSRNFDLVYDLQTNGRTKKYAKLFWPQKPDWCGHVEECRYFFPYQNLKHLHAFDLRRDQLRVAGIPDTPLPDLSWMQGDIARFHLPEKFVLLVPGSAPTRPEKRWPVSYYAILASALKKDGLTPVLIGTEAERDVTSAIAYAVEGTIDLTAQTDLFDIASLARMASGAVGNDTGPMHLISLAGCPTLSLFSAASNPDHSRPVGGQTAYLQESDLKNLPVSRVKETILLR